MNPISSAGRDRPLLPARAVEGFLWRGGRAVGLIRIDPLYLLAGLAGVLAGLAGWAW